jgi:hypothetical protein
LSALKRQDLYSLEEYSRIRDDFRRRVMSHKTSRRLPLGDNAALYFEDRLTMQYQIQEMLRIERIFTDEGIREELDSYNPLVPDGRNWKATFMLEYPDEKERRHALGVLLGIENHVWMQVEAHDRIRPFADEDLDRETAEKTSSVHFLRFELDEEMVVDLRGGATLAAGIDHPAYGVEICPIPDQVRASLLGDLA